MSVDPPAGAGAERVQSHRKATWRHAVRTRVAHRREEHLPEGGWGPVSRRLTPPPRAWAAVRPWAWLGVHGEGEGGGLVPWGIAGLSLPGPGILLLIKP